MVYSTKKDKGLEEEQIAIPALQIQEVRERMAEYKKNPGSALNFYESMDCIENVCNLK